MTIAARQSITPQTRKALAIVGAAILPPIGHLSYLIAIFWLQGYPISIEPVFSTTMFLYVLGLSLTGSIALLVWNWELQIAPVAALGALLVWPWYYHAGIGSVDYGALPFVILLIAAGFEGVAKFPERLGEIASGSTGLYALAAGLLHLVLGFGLQVYTRQFFWMSTPTLSGAELMGLLFIVSGLALVTAGATPVLLWRRERLVSPALMLAGWFLWGIYEAWRVRESLPLGDFVGIDWFFPVPYPDYLLKATILLLLLLAVAGSELAIRRVGRYIDFAEDKSAT